jgi:hypothetical protein
MPTVVDVYALYLEYNVNISYLLNDYITTVAKTPNTSMNQ